MLLTSIEEGEGKDATPGDTTSWSLVVLFGPWLGDSRCMDPVVDEETVGIVGMRGGLKPNVAPGGGGGGGGYE
jgi:hypothetical protein